MANYGYIFHSASDETREQMEQLGCCRIYIESGYDETSRPLRRHLIKRLKEGDCIIVPRLVHIVKGCSHLAALLRMCILKGVRLVAIEDKIDTGGLLYGDSPDHNIINAFRNFPYDFTDMKNNIGEKAFPRNINVSASRLKQDKRNEQVINMYMSGLSAEDIQRCAGVSKTTLYRILRSNDIERDRIKGRKTIFE